MRKFLKNIALLLACLLVLGCTSCGYRAVPSTEEELRTVFTLDGTYEVPYELYRFVYLAERDRAAASGEGIDFAVLDACVRREVGRLYAVLSLCTKNGIDPYGESVEDLLEGKIKDVIENESTGYGSYDAYLAEINANHMNDSVFRFYQRVAICEEMLADVLHASNFVAEDDKTVQSHYLGDGTVRATWIYLPYSNLGNYSDEMLDDIVTQAKNATDADFLRMTHLYYQPLYSDDELDTGFYFGKYQLSDEYRDLTETAFSLAVGETSGLIYAGEGAYVVRRLDKNPEYIYAEENMEYLRECYLLDAFYMLLSEEQARLTAVLVPSDVHATLNDETVK